MVKTVFVDWLFSIGAGLLFGLFSRSESGSRLASRGFRLGLAFMLLVMIPIAALAYGVSAGWMWMYWVDPAVLPVAIQVLAFAMYLVAFVAGFFLAPELERLRRGAGWAAVAVPAVGLAALQLLSWDRLTHVGTFAEYHAGRAAPLSGAMLALLAVGLPVAVLALAAMLRSLHRSEPRAAALDAARA